eukprot:1160241-Pelagomonas_calceolata.AAC.6
MGGGLRPDSSGGVSHVCEVVELGGSAAEIPGPRAADAGAWYCWDVWDTWERLVQGPPPESARVGHQMGPQNTPKERKKGRLACER